MSMDPGFVSGGEITTNPAAASPLPLDVTRGEVLPLREGDRVSVHVDGAAGMSAGGAEQIGQFIRGRLKLDELGFDVPVLVVSPGIRVQVARPA